MYVRPENQRTIQKLSDGSVRIGPSPREIVALQAVELEMNRRAKGYESMRLKKRIRRLVSRWMNLRVAMGEVVHG